MADFKPGDIVRCLNSASGFTKGNLYTVGGRYFNTNSGGSCGVIKDDNGVQNGWCRENFELAHSAGRPCIVAISGRAGYSPAPKPFVHENFELASKEAKRLAEANPGNEFAIYERVKGYRAEKPTAKEVA